MAEGATSGGKLGGVLDNIRGRAAGSVPAIGSMVASLARMGPIAAVVATVAVAIAAVASAAIDAARKQEQWLANLTTITGSSQKAQESYAALVQFASATPFDLGQSIEGFTKLRTLGLEATEGALTSFGNTAAAMGKPLNQMIEAVADAATGEFERLKEFGIKSKTQGDQVAFTFAGVTTKVKNNAADIQKYLEGLGNTKFAGAMARQMDTINGAVSNLEDNIFQMFAAIGSGQLGQAFKEIVKTISSGVAAATPLFASLGNVIGSIVLAVGGVINSLASLWSNFNTGGQGVTPILTALTVGFNLIAEGATVLGSVISAVFGAISSIVLAVRQTIADQFHSLLEWMGISFDTGGRSWGNSIVGVLRAVKAVVGIMPKLFSVAISDVMGMFRSLGSIVGRLLSGDITALKDIGSAITANFSNTTRALNAAGRIASAVYADQKGAAQAIERLKGGGGADAKLDTGTVLRPKPEPGKSKPGGASGDSAASKAADDAERKAKAEAEFWRTMEAEAEVAKLLPLAAEDYRKEQELQKIIGRDLNEQEKERVGTLNEQARTARFLTDALNKHNQAQLTIAGEEELYRKRLTGMTEDQLSVEREMLNFRNDAISRGVDLQSEGYKIAEAQARKDAERLGILKRQNDELESAIGFAKGAYGETPEGRRANASALYEQRIRNMTAARDAGAISTAEFEAGVKKAGEEFRDAVGQAADGFANKLGNVLNQWGDAIGGKLGEILGKMGNIFGSIGDFSKNAKSMTDAINGLFGNTDSPFIKGIGKAVGGAFAGLQIGEQIGNLGEALGLEGSGTGAKIGGAIGGLTGNPIIAAGASVIGAILGALFTTAPRGSAVITSGTNAQVQGNKASVREALTGTSGSIQNGLQAIAQQLGGEVGSFLVSIGKYKDHYRVSGAGSTQVGDKHPRTPLLYNGTDEAAAITAAISDAIQDGAITGLSDLMNKALKSYSGSIDKAINTALKLKSFEDDYKALTDPLRFAVDGVTGPLDELKKTMLEIGATSADLAKLEEYRAIKLQQVLKDQTKGFQDILDQLNGDAGGFTALSQLTGQLQEMAGLRAAAASGQAIDQETFTDLANRIIENAGNVYGMNTTDYQAIVSTLRDTATNAIANVSSLVSAASQPSAPATDTSTAAINAQTDAITAQQGITNDLLRQILGAQTARNDTGVNYGGSGYYNGHMSYV